jgi:acetyl esterase/lipase
LKLTPSHPTRLFFATFILLFDALSSVAEEVDGVPDGITIISNIRYREGESKSWTMDLALPKVKPGDLRPAIVVIHGGGWLQGDKSSFSVPANRPPGNIIDFARLGFVAATINYRLSGEALFPAAVHDCKNAVRFLRAHAKEYGIKPDQIGAWGNSAGGHLALMLGMAGPEAELEGDGSHLDQSSLVQSVVSDSGPIDLVHQVHHDQVKYAIIPFLGGEPTGERLDAYRKATPTTYISSKTPPLLLIYGVTDEQVGVETSDQFVVALDQSGLKDVTYLRLAQVGHCPYSLKRISIVPPIVNEFFVRTLRLQESKIP